MSSLPNAYYASDIGHFQRQSEHEILGQLASASRGVDSTQQFAWEQEVAILKTELADCEGTILLEFDVPRLGSRIDAVVVTGPALFVLEFKVGEQGLNVRDLHQVWDYALDLKNFYSESRTHPIFPVLVPTSWQGDAPHWVVPASDGVYPPVCCEPSLLGNAIASGIRLVQGPPLDGLEWAAGRYSPTPTIVEAAQALYARHTVANITRHDAGARNLAITAGCVEQIIDSARQSNRKSIVFLTGVPGAGKTLVGLDIATRRRGDTPTHSVFLSGNGPLVSVLREALARDELLRLRASRTRARKGEVVQQIKPFIQNVHHFRDEGLKHDGPPVDHVVIFDEAQRAWNREMTAQFMKQKKGRPGFQRSEPEFLLSYVDKHTDWATVICLVGGGQEINRGEAGIAAWLEAVSTSFRHWTVHISPNIVDSEYAAGHVLERLGAGVNVRADPALHLAVSMRSFRAENLSNFIKALLDLKPDDAKVQLGGLRGRYPIVLTRSLERAKQWIRDRARGTERFGLVASSSAQRLKAHAIDVRVKIDPVHWFLNDRDDTRSSFYLEDAATEFQVQGLELDWVCVGWDADLRFGANRWSWHSFKGTAWERVKSPQRREYLRNAYRVLLTRARQGMVIFVPPGNEHDHTRKPEYYDDTFEYLSRIGLDVI